MSEVDQGCTRLGIWQRIRSSNSGKLKNEQRCLCGLFFNRQAGQTSSSDVKKRDLRAELLLAEEEARNKKRKAQGLPPLAVESGRVAAAEDEESRKRQKLLADALELDKDDEDDNEGKEGDAEGDNDQGEDSDEDSDDDTAELLRELEKIKRERAEEAERVARAQTESREADIATANPLLNLAAALGKNVPQGINTTVPGTFAVKRRWDDDLIFKNQAIGTGQDKSGKFVNDLLRTEFHKYVDSIKTDLIG